MIDFKLFRGNAFSQMDYMNCNSRVTFVTENQIFGVKIQKDSNFLINCLRASKMANKVRNLKNLCLLFSQPG